MDELMFSYINTIISISKFRCVVIAHLEENNMYKFKMTEITNVPRKPKTIWNQKSGFPPVILNVV